MMRLRFRHLPPPTTTQRWFWSSSPLHQQSSSPVTIGIMRETYNRWERRAPLSPAHVEQLLQHYTANGSSVPPLNVVVQPSPLRIFSDQDYVQAGALLSDDLSSAHVILGVKRPSSAAASTLLLPDKTFVFFSHTIKGQPENMQLLQYCLDHHIQLLDYERMMHEENGGGATFGHRRRRLVAFGRYAGLAGCMDSFHALGRRLLYRFGTSTPFLSCPPALLNDGLDAARARVQQLADRLATNGGGLNLPEPLVLAVTGGGGAVHEGVMELLRMLPHETVLVDDLPQVYQEHEAMSRDGSSLPSKVYLVPTYTADIMRRHPSVADDDNRATDFDRVHFRANPSQYRSTFHQKVAPYAHAVYNCIYWDPRYPRLLSKPQMKRLAEQGNNRLMLVADITCDVNGSMECLERVTTIEKPFFQYDPLTQREVADSITDRGVTVLGVDILPTEFPRESSEHFGDAMVNVVQQLASNMHRNQQKLNVKELAPGVAGSVITTADGQLMPSYGYLESFLARATRVASVSHAKTMQLSMEGHLFDSGFINQVMDAIELNECGLELQECVFPSHAPTEKVKSSVVLRVYAKHEDKLQRVYETIVALARLIDKAEATIQRLDVPSDDESGAIGRAYVEATPRRVLLLGAGMVSKTLVEYLGRNENVEVMVASDIEVGARDVASVAKNGKFTALNVASDRGRLSDLVEDADAVISLLPAPMHPMIARECIAHQTDLVTASYESDEMRQLGGPARQAGIVMLNEVGLDPGLDHMSAMRMIDAIHSRGGTVTGFSSVCGGLPAPEAANNPFQYKFSWSPRGVIRASQNAARFRQDGDIQEVCGVELLQHATPFKTEDWPDLELECLPNRNSLHYESVYGIPDAADMFFRGTLRYEGFSALMNTLKNAGLFDETVALDAMGGDVMSQLSKRRGGFGSVQDFLLACADEDESEARRALDALKWLGMLNGITLDGSSTAGDVFCRALEAKLQYGPNERDMVAMHHTIDAVFADGSRERHTSSLRAFGDARMSAMAKTVGYTTAAATELVLSGALETAPGLLLPITANIYEPILAAMEREDIVFNENVYR